MVGMMMGEILKVEDGWAEFDQKFSNEEGETSKEQFGELLKLMIPWEVILENTLQPKLLKIYEKLGGSNEEQVGKVTKRLAKKIPSYLPIVTNAIFRFFDSDGSGTISKDEIILCMGGMFGSEGKPDIKFFIPALFRTLDEDSSGSIEPVEVAPFVSEVLGALAHLAEAMIKELETDLKGGMKDKLLKKIGAIYNDAMESGVPLPLSKETMIELIVSQEDDVREAFEGVQQLPPIPEGIKTVAQAFFDSFDKIANGEALPIRRVANLLSQRILPCLTLFCQPEAVEGLVRMGAEAAGDLPVDIDDLDLTDVIPTMAFTMNTYFKSGALKRYLEAFLSFLDVDNNGSISKEELQQLYIAVVKAYESEDADAFFVNVQEVAGVLFDMLDSDGSGTLDMDDVPKVYEKFVELAISLGLMGVDLVKKVIEATSLPILNMAFGMFTEDGTVTYEMAQMLGGMILGDD